MGFGCGPFRLKEELFAFGLCCIAFFLASSSSGLGNAYFIGGTKYGGGFGYSTIGIGGSSGTLSLMNISNKSYLSKTGSVAGIGWSHF